MSVRTLPFSQGTFGGPLACTSCACLTGCAFADGTQLTLQDYEKYTRVGSKLWRLHGKGSLQSAEYVMNNYDFFKDTYDIESFQINLATLRDLQGRISLAKFFEQFDDPKDNYKDKIINEMDSV